MNHGLHTVFKNFRRANSVLLACFFCWTACSEEKPVLRQVQPSFYYWKTVYDLPPDITERVRKIAGGRMYLRFFDVEWNSERADAFPVSDIVFRQQPAADTLVPVVYVTNEALREMPDTAVRALGARIFTRVAQLMTKAGNPPWPEIQLDCDWSESTKERYFALVKNVADSLHAKQKKLSVTIRLHQVKYFEKTGVPPADRGTLMFYNMGDLSDPKTKNSIYDPAVAGNYLVNFDRYPLALDLALPWFSWTVVQRNGKTAGLLNNMDEKQFAALKNVERIGAYRARVLQPQRIEGHDLQAGDLLRLEPVSLENCRAAAAQIAPYIRERNLRVIFFDLDQKQFTDETEKELEAVLAELR
ncbi:MAG: hypothetical protein FD123_3228 [Bacteroidetes bacterium]|nr:MAG: hypothetical protein FD123_3228 [Bacteroidota bacterium]